MKEQVNLIMIRLRKSEYIYIDFLIADEKY
jgi:hypothetical protein